MQGQRPPGEADRDPEHGGLSTSPLVVGERRQGGAEQRRVAYQFRFSATGTQLAGTVAARLPPTAVVVPTRAAGTRSRPASEAFWAPVTQNRARPGGVEGEDEVLPAGDDRVPQERRDPGDHRDRRRRIADVDRGR